MFSKNPVPVYRFGRISEPAWFMSDEAVCSPLEAKDIVFLGVEWVGGGPPFMIMEEGRPRLPVDEV